MSKVGHYLQEHLTGEIISSTDARHYFATDGSVLQMAPLLVAYPRNENDIRKTCRFTWQLAERGRVIGVTARGSGTDQGGAAIGQGIMLVFPAHMHRILELDTKTNTVTIEPGINYGKLQQTLHTHGRFLPPYPASIEYSTVGGAIANNSTGERTVKYGDMSAYVQSLRVVLANGEVIETGRLGKRDLSKKLGLATFEGEIYRQLDTLLEENASLIDQMRRNVFTDKAGYNLGAVKAKDGSLDLTPLFVGSQGTLGVISEAVLQTEAHNPQTIALLAGFDSLENLQQAILQLRSLKEQPCIVELVDGYLLQQVDEINPNQLKGLYDKPYPAALLLVEFDQPDRHAKKLTKQASKIFEQLASSLHTAVDPEQQQQFWKLRQASGTLVSHNEGQAHAVPLLTDASVPLDRLREYMDKTYALLDAAGVRPALWGHAGVGTLYLQPRFNLGQIGDRQKAFRLMDELNKLAISLGGTVSGEQGDGRLRAPYLPLQFGAEAYGLLQKVKQVFDPYGTLNPGVKFGTSIDDIKAALRPDYSLEHFYDHLPRS